ncbi:MAG: glycoside hydrolase family 88 protein [Acutalibacteraceae bacterium]
MKVLLVILILFAVAVIAALSFDAVPFALSVLGRRQIGTMSGGEWYSAASSVILKWLSHGLPSVPVNAGRRLVIIDIIKKRYKADSIQAWQEASVLLAANEISPQKAGEFIDSKIDPTDGSWLKSINRVDSAFLAYAVLCSGETDSIAVKPAMDETYNMLIKKFDEFGSIPYSADSDIRFVDTIGMVCPFLIKYSLTYDEPKALEAAVSLIKEYADNAVHDSIGLPAHCFNAKTGAPLGIYGWGRGCGWWACGLSESFAVLNETGPDEYVSEKTLILKQMLKFAKCIVSYQSENGAFDRNVLARSGEDSSATAMLALFLAYTGKLSSIKEYTDCAERAMKYIYSCTRRDGTVDYSQGDTMGIGFYSGESIVLPAAQGFAVRAYLMLGDG